MANERITLDDKQDTEVKIPCEVYSRIVGYLRPVQAWNEGKKQEFEERLTFKSPDARGS